MDNHVRQAKGMLVLLTKLPVLVILVMFAILHLILIMLVQGLIKGVREYFPDAEHRHCVRHIWQNFQNIHKGDALKSQIWKCARSNTSAIWDANMEQLKSMDIEAYNWLEQLPPNTWVRGFQRFESKCDILLNNNCEVFNK